MSVSDILFSPPVYLMWLVLQKHSFLSNFCRMLIDVRMLSAQGRDVDVEAPKKKHDLRALVSKVFFSVFQA